MLLPKLPNAMPVAELFSITISRTVSKLCKPPPNQMTLLRMIPPEDAGSLCPDACLPPVWKTAHVV